MSAYPPGRPVLSEACQRRAAELVATAPPLSSRQRIAIAATWREIHRWRAACRLGRAS